MTHSKSILLSAFVAATLVATGARAESTGTAIDDSLITTKVKASLIKDPIAKSHQIKVKTHGGVVQLNGFVDSPDARQAAVADAKAIEGVTSVDDNLKIRAPHRTAGQAVDDSAITAKVKTALIEDKRTKAHQIEVKTNDGVVSLGGFVDTAGEKAAAADVAMTVKGVTKVDNGLSVK